MQRKKQYASGVYSNGFFSASLRLRASFSCFHSAHLKGIPMHENEIGTIIIDAAIAVHRELGPGLLESVYEIVLAHELSARGLQVRRQVPIPIRYHDIQFDEGFRADLLIEDKVVVELKSVERVSPAHRKQIQTHLRLSDRRLRYLLNFGEALLKDGITRAVNKLQEE
jgi:GxxExxY protein